MRPTMPDDPDKPVLLLRCGSAFEAELRASVIRGAGIDVRTVTAAASTLWHMGPAIGYPYDVYVRAADVDRANEALREAAMAGRAGAADDEATDVFEADAIVPEAPATSMHGSTAFALGLAAGLLTVFVPIVLAAAITAPLSRSERTVLCALWVLFFGMTAYALRDRLPVGGGTVARERDDGVDRRHFRDSRVALIGWFLLGAGFFGPSTFFFVGVLLLPVINTLSRYTSMAGPVLMGAWCVLCGFWTARHAQRRQRARAAARRAPTLAR